MEIGIRESEFGMSTRPPGSGVVMGTDPGTEETVGEIRRMEP